MHRRRQTSTEWHVLLCGQSPSVGRDPQSFVLVPAVTDCQECINDAAVLI